MNSTITFTALKLLPELFPLIASHLPLYATPSSLLSLALTNHGIYEIVHDLLYSRLILRNEMDAISTFQRILTTPELGKLVRELHAMSELTVGTMNGETVSDTVTGLEKGHQSRVLAISPHIFSPFVEGMLPRPGLV